MSANPESGPSILAVEAPPPDFKPGRLRSVRIGILAILLIVAAAILLPVFGIRAKETQFLTDLRQRLEILAQGRAEVIATGLDGTLRLGNRVAESEIFRLFAAEMHLAQGDVSQVVGKPGEGPLTAQLPYMTQLLTEFVRNEGFAAGYMLGRDGTLYLSATGAPALTAAQRERAGAVLAGEASAYGPLRETAQGLALDLFLSLAPPQAGRDGVSPALIVLTTPVAARLTEWLAAGPLAQPGETLRLVQRDAAGFVEVAPGQSLPLRPVTFGPVDAGVTFALRPPLGGGEAVYSAGRKVRGPDWWLVQEADATAARAGVRNFTAATVALAALVVIVVIAAFGAFWWRLLGEHSKALAAQYRKLAARIAAQKNLLDGINNTIADYIGLKSLTGDYTYVNPAFAAAIGRPVDRVLGLDDAALFGKDTSRRLAQSDRQALAVGAAVTVSEEIYLDAKRHHLQISKVPLRDEGGAVSGIVSVARDITDLVEQQEQRERAVRQMVVALVRAVELRDPYLAGHSRRVAGFGVLVARRLGATAEQVATVEIAANLSQIGKLSIDPALLTKPGRLTPEENARMRQHVDHARTVLHDIDFGLPVLETIVQMNERLDGDGYPNGLRGDAIGLTARVLGACDVFCARTAPRAYRPAIPAAEALGVLQQHPERYDAEVVRALADIATSPAGEKLLAN